MRFLIQGRALAIALGAAMLAVACGSSTAAGPGTVSVLAEWSGQEQANFEAVLKPFMDQTGIKVTYESTRDLTAVIKTRVAAGNPPDLAGVPNPQLLSQFAGQNKLVPLDGVLDMTALKQNYSQGWIDLGTYQGKLYQVYSWVSLKGLVWYNPKTFQAKGYAVPTNWDGMISLQNQIKSTGVTPWCIGLKSGGADDGWPGSDWLKEIVLSQSGPTVYDNWVAGKQKWTSPEIKSAFTTWGTILGPNDANAYGGAIQIAATSFKTSGDGLFTKPPKCYMHNQASFITSFFTSDNPSVKPVTDFNFFPLPDVSSQFTGAHVVAGDSWGLFHDSAAARKLLQYLTTAEAQAIWVKAGGKLSPNKQTPLDDYPDPLSKESAQLLVSTQIAKYDATDNMPADMRTAAWQAVLKFVQNQNNLDTILANLDKVQATAYSS